MVQRDLGASSIRRASEKITGALQYSLSLSQKGMICCICSFGFEDGQMVSGLGCHPRHIIHEHCYGELIEFFKDNASCPLCRLHID